MIASPTTPAPHRRHPARHGTLPASPVLRLAPQSHHLSSHHACTCIPSHLLVFCQCQCFRRYLLALICFAFTSSLSPPPYLFHTRIHQFIFLIRTGLLLVFAGSATPGPPRAFMLIGPSFYDFWLLTPPHATFTLHSPLYIHSSLFLSYPYSYLLSSTHHRVHASTTAHGSLSSRIPVA